MIGIGDCFCELFYDLTCNVNGDVISFCGIGDYQKVGKLIAARRRLPLNRQRMPQRRRERVWRFRQRRRHANTAIGSRKENWLLAIGN
jgi:hypothetical protein